ncbi:MAG: acyl carrier protein [Clostridia bacterium]|nr:acyl carrier protein [Clostridia bacterium]
MTYAALTEILRQCGAVCTGDVSPDARLREDLQMTSFGMMLLLMRLESDAGRQLTPSDLLHVKTMNDLCSCLGVEP